VVVLIDWWRDLGTWYWFLIRSHRMGVQDLHSHFINRSSYEKRDNKPQHSLSELDGPVGIDVSTIMYRHLRTALGSAVIDVEPAVPLYHAFHEITNTIMLLTGKHKLDIVLCFDNKPHPMKADTQTSRRLDLYRI
jgi:hypothetical protein